MANRFVPVVVVVVVVVDVVVIVVVVVAVVVGVVVVVVVDDVRVDVVVVIVGGIFLAQLCQFKFMDDNGSLQWLEGTQLYLLLGLIALTMAIIHFLPKFTRAVPSSLAAILVVTILAVSLNLDTRSVGDIASIAGGLPSFHLPQVRY